MSLRDFIFGSEAMAPIQKDGARAEAGAPKVEAMLNMISRAGERHAVGVDPVFSAADVAGARRAESWLDSRLLKGRVGQFTEPAPVVVTPAMAEVMLGRNHGNRVLRKNAIEKYRRALRDGRWFVTHQGIAFDRNGILRDGQHRLAAIAAEGRDAEMVVTFGLDPEAFAVLDTGAGRSAADVLLSRQRGGGANLAAAIRCALAIQRGDYYGKIAIHNDEIDSFAAREPGFVDFVSQTNSIRQGRAALHASVGLVVGLWLISRAAPVVKYDEFCEAIKTGLGFVSKSDPALVLRNAIVSGALRNTKPQMLAAAVIIAWNSWVQGRSLKVVKWDGGAFPVALRGA
jgi:hypothetical protein